MANIYNEDTQYLNTSNNGGAAVPPPPPANNPYMEESMTAENKPKQAKWLTIAGGVGGGLLIGGIAAAVVQGTDANAAETTGEDVAPVEVDRLDTITDGTVPVAHNVTDEMSFQEAWQAARDEVGTGGAFEWRGGVYGTFSASEWNSMSMADKREYWSHFNWENVDTDYNPPMDVHHQEVVYTYNETHHHHHDHVHVHVEDPLVNEEPVVVPHEQDPNMHNTGMNETPNVEVIGVNYDPDNEMYYGELRINDIPAVVVDVDGDQVFDVMYADTNLNGQLDDDDYVDPNFGEAGLTVSDLQDELLAQNAANGNSGSQYQASYESYEEPQLDAQPVENHQPVAEEPVIEDPVDINYDGEIDFTAQADVDPIDGMSDFDNSADAGAFMA